ncbi:hypothetical protein ACQKQD_12230 [Methylobacterium sp. NPDC080182]|uniref:hypothetical protein n=1 Tax=Methylobacterium sp. NPDC080182 TaxID=3390590 RepID=UPI003D00147B
MTQAEKEKSRRAGQGAAGSTLTQKRYSMNSHRNHTETQALRASVAKNLRRAAEHLSSAQDCLQVAADAIESSVRAAERIEHPPFEVSQHEFVRQVIDAFGAPRQRPWVMAFPEHAGCPVDVTTHLPDVPAALRQHLPRLVGQGERVSRNQVREAWCIWRTARAAYAIRDFGQLADVAAECREMFGQPPSNAAYNRSH